jgi:hypothetical protein
MAYEIIQSKEYGRNIKPVFSFLRQTNGVVIRGQLEQMKSLKDYLSDRVEFNSERLICLIPVFLSYFPGFIKFTA